MSDPADPKPGEVWENGSARRRVIGRTGDTVIYSERTWAVQVNGCDCSLDDWRIWSRTATRVEEKP